jgi:UMF1 family MFS transporter
MGGNWGLPMTTAMTISFCIIGAWWIGITLPLLKQYKQKNYVEVKKGAVKASFGRLWETLKQMSKNKKVFFFLIAFFCYIDGVYTIIDMATAYGQALGLDTTGLLLALLVTQVVAWPFSILFGRLSKKYNSNTLITICICAYTGIAFYALFLVSLTQFWILAVCVGMFQGAIQALSRSYFAKIIPAEKSGEYFGIYDICGKGASFLGTKPLTPAITLTRRNTTKAKIRK